MARLAAQTAEQYKREQTLQGEGDAAKKRAVMEADGALELKLKALVAINGQYAEALKGARLVPEIQMGGGAGAGQAANSVSQLVELLTAHSARQLGIELGVSGAGKTTQQHK